MRHTTARHHPHTPTRPRKEKTGKEGGTGEPAADREPQNINIETPRTRQPGSEEASHIVDARVHYAVHNQPAHTPSHNFLEEGVFGPGRTAPEPDSVPRPAPMEPH